MGRNGVLLEGGLADVSVVCRWHKHDIANLQVRCRGGRCCRLDDDAGQVAAVDPRQLRDAEVEGTAGQSISSQSKQCKAEHSRSHIHEQGREQHTVPSNRSG